MDKSEFKLDNGKVLRILPINPVVRLESNRYYAQAFNEAITNGYQLKLEVEKMLESKGLLDTTKDELDSENIRGELKLLEISLRKGVLDNKKLSKDDGRKVALSMRKLREKLSSKGRTLNSYFQNTAESYAENVRIQFFVFSCTVDATSGVRYWKSFEEFKNDSGPVIDAATSKFFNVITNLDVDYEKTFYENRWLIARGYMNDKMEFVRPDGRIIDEDGQLIDAEGRFINESGAFVDKFGNLIDKEGNLLVGDVWETEIPTTTPVSGVVTAPAIPV